MIDRYGSDAYPFNKQRAVQLETKRFEECTLASTFGKRLLFQSNGGKVTISDFSGKYVFVIIAPPHKDKFLSEVQSLYLRHRGRDTEFSVVYLITDSLCLHHKCALKDKSDLKQYTSTLSWLVHTMDFEFSCNLRNEVFCRPNVRNELFSEFHEPDVMIFGKDGQLVAREARVRDLSEEYPFINADCQKQISLESGLWESGKRMHYSTFRSFYEF